MVAWQMLWRTARLFWTWPDAAARRWSSYRKGMSMLTRPGLASTTSRAAQTLSADRHIHSTATCSHVQQLLELIADASTLLHAYLELTTGLSCLNTLVSVMVALQVP